MFRIVPPVELYLYVCLLEKGVESEPRKWSFEPRKIITLQFIMFLVIRNGAFCLHELVIRAEDYFRYRRMAQFNLPTEQRTLLFNFHGAWVAA